MVVNEVCESRNMPESMVQLLGEGISTSCDSGQDGTISFGQTCSNIDKSFILPGPFASKPVGHFIGNFNYDKGDENIFPTFHPFEKGVENFAMMGRSLQKANCSIFSMSPSYHKGKENVFSLLPCDKVPENLFMIESSYHKENANVLSGGQSPYMAGSEIAFMISSQDRADQNNDQISHGDRSKTISFGGYQKETTTGSPLRVIKSCENFSHAPATAKDPLRIEAEEDMSFEFRVPPYASPRVDTLPVPKSKDLKTAKKGSTKTFPTCCQPECLMGLL